MAKFVYRMQNILDIKYKLEEAAKQEYAEKRARLNEEEAKLDKLKERKEAYYRDYVSALQGKLDYLKIDNCAQAVEIMKMYIDEQNEQIKKCSRELEQARIQLNQVMQERKMHEKLKEKKFDMFVSEVNAAENKETDQLVSYMYNNSDTREE